MVSAPLRIYLAYTVARASILAHASALVEVIPLKDWEIRAHGLYWRSYWVNPRGQMFDDIDCAPFTTDFTYTRFLVPALERFEDRTVIFADPDTLWRADAHELAALLPPDEAVACVKHEHRPDEFVKVTGNLQSRYGRKNWSSVMVMNPARCRALTPFRVNRESRDWLHGFAWLRDRDIAELPQEWNWLDGYSPETVEPKIVHFTRGTPDMPDRASGLYDDEWLGLANKLRQLEIV